MTGFTCILLRWFVPGDGAGKGAGSEKQSAVIIIELFNYVGLLGGREGGVRAPKNKPQ